MSSLSLNRLCNGGGRSKNKNFNFKFGSSSTLPHSKSCTKFSQEKISDINNNGNAPIPITRRKLLNPRGSLYHNQFKGVKKELIEKHATLIVHTMTVSHILFFISDLYFHSSHRFSFCLFCLKNSHIFFHLHPHLFTHLDRGALRGNSIRNFAQCRQ